AGTLARFDPDGTPTRTYPVPDNNDVVALWGSSAMDVWAAGYNQVLLHFDGLAWSQPPLGQASGSTYRFSLLAGSGPQDVWLIGEDVNSALHGYRYDGAKWGEVTLPAGLPSGTIHCLWVSPQGQVWIGGGSLVFHSDNHGS